MINEKGELLYDDSKSSKTRPFSLFYFTFMGIVFVSTAIFIFIAIISIYINAENQYEIKDIILMSVLHIVVMIFGCFFIIIGRTMNYVKIYENGFDCSNRTLIQVIHRDKNYISFNSITELYPNTNDKDKNIIIIKKTTPNIVHLPKSYLKDIDIVLNYLEENVNVIWDRNYSD
jgi:hypothetical protein